MNNKYLLIIIVIAFLCSGCSVDYNIDIDKKLDFVEDINLNSTSDEDTQKIKEFNSFVPINVEADDSAVFEKKYDDIEYYDIRKSNENNKLIFNYVSNIDKFNNDMFARSCYQYITLMKKNEDKDLLLSTSRKFLCFDKYENLDDVTVTITSKYKLKETNADVVENHKYTWYINKDNADNKFVYLLLDITDRDLTLWERILEGEYVNIFTISLLLLVIGLVIYFILKKKGDRKNKI